MEDLDISEFSFVLIGNENHQFQNSPQEGTEPQLQDSLAGGYSGAGDPAQELRV